MKNHYVLYRNGLAKSTDIFVHNDKICIRENSSGGEHLLYISNNSEEDLLRVLEQKNLLKRIFRRFGKEKLSKKQRKENLILLLSEKFSYVDKDPNQEIHLFLKKHKIKYIGEYWPDSDRF